MHASTASEQAEAVAALRRGALVVYPTETLYGLGADATNEAALERLVELKVRPAGKPISVLVSSREMLDRIAARVTPLAERLMTRFWPGPLTLVVAARAGVSEILTAGSGSIGVRLSSHPVATALVAALGRPLTSPSANPAGAEPSITIGQARAYFGDRVALYLDGGRLQGGVGSTVVDVTGEQLRIVRQGTVSRAALRAVLSEAA
jgi:L-threonylcarbamoyladenylate synthase